MSDGVRPVPGVTGADRRGADRRATQRRGGKAAGDSRDLVVAGEPVDHPAEPAARPAPTAADLGPAAAFAAQLIGQGGQRNGIRGGPPVMDNARATYLGAEYSGEKERRPPAGKTKATDV